jgi:hypothetical protein
MKKIKIIGDDMTLDEAKEIADLCDEILALEKDIRIMSKQTYGYANLVFTEGSPSYNVTVKMNKFGIEKILSWKIEEKQILLDKLENYKFK